jgi:hydrogenase-4 transcriptional activator
VVVSKFRDGHWNYDLPARSQALEARPVDRHALLLLDVWREVSRHVEIGETLERVLPHLAKKLPAQVMLVRRLDLTGHHVETLAVSGSGRDGLTGQQRLSERELENLAAWCRRGRILHASARDLPRELPGLVPPELAGDVLAGPLTPNGGFPALLALAAPTPKRFTREQETLVEALLEPFGVALENDRRARDLVTLREAAEAERRSLLSRLGRQDQQERIVGVEAGLRSCMERVDLVAPSDVPVLLFGETGSGKEVVARAIHMRSPRAAAPFLRVNCGAIPPSLIDSELFGHERGSFTGAEAQRKGWFERAHGGTLFLDEIGELPLPAQVRLLRVLQDGSFERVGGQRALHADVRVVAATHRDLHSMVQEKTFREDLWYRLAVFVIHVPPLRERPEDIPALALHFALRAATRFGTPPLAPTPEDLELLLAYPWPGNARELISVMERAVILGNGRRLEVAKALGTGAARAPESAPLSPREAPYVAQSATSTALDAAMVRHIEDALARCHGRIEGPFGAAKLLHINPHTLRSRMRKHGIDWRRYRLRAD